MTRIIIAFLVVCLTTAACTQKNERAGANAQAEEQVNEYPPIVLQQKDGQEIYARDLKGDNIFVFFQPDCEDCQEEAMHIEQRLNEFQDYTLYFISSAPMEQITSFSENFNLDGKERVKFAWSSTEGVLEHYGSIRTPSLYIYSEGRLKAQFNGRTDIDTILSEL